MSSFRYSACLFMAAAILLLIGMVVLGGSSLYQRSDKTDSRSARVRAWIANPAAHPDWALTAGTQCPGAPFIFPTDGFPGFLWDDSFRAGHRHQGIDIFGGAGVGVTPVVAAYPGYLTRLPDWKSTVILRIPEDPLQPGRQVWTYYTHMADQEGNSLVSPEFPPGTAEVYVPAGTLLGYQGNYSGDPLSPVGIHLHFSIVLDDGQGRFRNELEFENTVDPSPYFGLPLNANTSDGQIPTCAAVEGAAPLPPEAGLSRKPTAEGQSWN